MREKPSAARCLDYSPQKYLRSVSTRSQGRPNSLARTDPHFSAEGSMADELTGRFSFDAAALAALQSGASAEVLAALSELAAAVDRLAAQRVSVLCSRVEASELMGISPSTLDTIDDLPFVKIGARKMFRRAALERWCEQREHAAAAAAVS